MKMTRWGLLHKQPEELLSYMTSKAATTGPMEKVSIYL